MNVRTDRGVVRVSDKHKVPLAKVKRDSGPEAVRLELSEDKTYVKVLCLYRGVTVLAMPVLTSRRRARNG